MKRLFWLGMGAAAGVALTRRAHEARSRLRADSMGASIGAGLRELADAVGSFGADVRAGMEERERELTHTVAARTGIDPSHPTAPIPAQPARWQAPEQSQGVEDAPRSQPPSRRRH